MRTMLGNFKPIIVALSLSFVITLALTDIAAAQELGLCGGEINANTIDPSRSSINALLIFTHFPNDPGNPGHDDIPPFAGSGANFVRNYYLSMSYGKHTVNAQVINRPYPNGGQAFDASNTIAYYRTHISELNTSTLNAAWNENNNVFTGVDFIFMFYEGGIYAYGTARGNLIHSSSHYSGDGVTMEYLWGTDREEALKWHLVHEYGHQIALPGRNIIQDQEIIRSGPNIIPGPYDIMYKVYGGGIPPMAAFHMNYLGWLENAWIRDIDPTTTGDLTDLKINDTREEPPAGEYNAYRIVIPGTANERFFLENRQGTSYDSELAGTGLIIWHVFGNNYPYLSTGKDVEVAIPTGLHGEDWLDNIPDGTPAGLGYYTDFFNNVNKKQITPWTNPSTETGYLFYNTHAPSGLAITNIDYDGEIDMVFDVIENFTSGEIAEDSWWDGAINITGNITVASGVTLTVESGATANLNGNYIRCVGSGRIINNGTINGYTHYAQSGSDYKGYFPSSVSIQQIIDWASSGWNIYIGLGTFSGSDIYMKTGVNLHGNGITNTTVQNDIYFDGATECLIEDMTVTEEITIQDNEAAWANYPKIYDVKAKKRILANDANAALSGIIGDTGNFYLSVVNTSLVYCEDSQFNNISNCGIYSSNYVDVTLTNGVEIHNKDTGYGIRATNTTYDQVKIKLMLNKPEHVNLKIFNLLGKEVMTLYYDNLTQGQHTIVWDGMDQNRQQASSGIYFFVCQTSSQKITSKFLLLK